MNEKIHDAGRSMLQAIRAVVLEEIGKTQGNDAAERELEGTLGTSLTPLSSINSAGEARIGVRNGTVSR